MKSKLGIILLLILGTILISCTMYRDINESTKKTIDPTSIFLPTEKSTETTITLDNESLIPIIQQVNYVKFDFSKIIIVYRVAISPDGEKIAVSNGDGIWFYDIKTQSLIWKAEPMESTINMDDFPIAWEPNSEVLVSGFPDGKIDLWDLRLQKRTNLFKIQNTPITNLVWSSDGKLLAVTAGKALGNGNLYIWDMDSSSIAWTFPIMSSFSWRIDISANKSFVVESTSNFPPYDFRIWNLLNGQEYLLDRYSNLPDKKSGSLNVDWHPMTELISPLYGGCAGIYGVKWSPDGKYLITVDNCYGELSMWDINSGRMMYTIDGANWEAIWSPNGKYFAFDTYKYDISNSEEIPPYIQIYQSGSGKPFESLICPARVPEYRGVISGNMIWIDNKLLAVNLSGELCLWEIQ
jgi:WD40 repeat protein